MHIKSLVSPVGALTGSGNLTPSAVGEHGGFRNDEHLTYAGLEHGGPYERLRVEVDEAFERMELLDTSSIAPPDARPGPVRRRPRSPRPQGGNQRACTDAISRTNARIQGQDRTNVTWND